MSNVTPIVAGAALAAPYHIPQPAAFRAWLSAALAALEVSPGRVSRDLGLGKNSLTQFLGAADDSRDLRLGTAARLHADLTARARAAGVALPPVAADD